jgi:hypothetical protein
LTSGSGQVQAGYPRYAALLSTHPAFHNFRSFTRARMRLLLIKKDEIAVFEQSLGEVDAAEERDLFLGCLRRDTNIERRTILQNLKSTISE